MSKKPNSPKIDAPSNLTCRLCDAKLAVSSEYLGGSYCLECVKMLYVPKPVRLYWLEWEKNRLLDEKYNVEPGTFHELKKDSQ